MLVSPSAASTLPSNGSPHSHFPQRRTGVRSRTTGSEELHPGASSRDLHQMKRLRYLLDAREAKVQAVLDEAMSWLIVPFAGEAKDIPLSSNISAPAAMQPASAQESSLALSPSSGDEGAGVEAAGQGSTSPSKTEEVAAESAVVNASESFSATTGSPALSPEKGHSPLNKLLPGGMQTEVKEGPLQCDPPTSTALAAVVGSSANEDIPDASSNESSPELLELMDTQPEAMTFTFEELEKLDAEAAWDELEAEEEKYGWDRPLLPKLVAASPIAAAQKKAQTAGVIGAPGVDSPKRKRGRPKGSGKKNKSRLDNANYSAPPVAAIVTLSDVLPQDSPSLPLYDSQSPGCSAATNSPPSLWSGNSVDTFPPLADLLDFSADPMSLLGSGLACPPLPSPATPSSRGSSMLRSTSSASFNSSAAAARQDEAGGLKGNSPCVRSARIHAGVQARRLFGVEEGSEDFEESYFIPKETKKSSKSKTGRPRGRPRKIRPNERTCAEGEDL